MLFLVQYQTIILMWFTVSIWASVSSQSKAESIVRNQQKIIINWNWCPCVQICSSAEIGNIANQVLSVTVGPDLTSSKSCLFCDRLDNWDLGLNLNCSSSHSAISSYLDCERRNWSKSKHEFVTFIFNMKIYLDKLR